TGDILDPQRTKYDLKYYVHLAKELERMGAHILAIKDMAGLCKPYAASLLVKTLRREIGIPIHFHTHDTAGIQAGAILESAEVGLDIADAAMAPLSGGTSQPNLNTLVEALRFTGRASSLDARHLDEISEYWRAVREFYRPFESPVLPAGANLYEHEMPGGQYTNLFQQAHALGLADQWTEICRAYTDANLLLGDIVKVTPTSKAVGDLALFMVANELSSEDLLDGRHELAFPQSVIDLVSGKMGQTPGGFPKKIRQRILRGAKPLRGRPGASLPAADFQQAASAIQPLLDREPVPRETVSYLLYPRVFEEFVAHQRQFGDISVLPTPVFLYGLEPGEETAVEIERGKTLIIKFLTAGEPHGDGRRTVFFELNGQPRELTVQDHSLEPDTPHDVKADPSDDGQVGASMPGMVVGLAVQAGDAVVKGQKLLMLEAMKMQTTVLAPRDGKIAQVLVKPGMQVDGSDLLLTIE
ncbi:MAG: biotin/lipoyl-containing protein, partial [Pirellulales bacterium]